MSAESVSESEKKVFGSTTLLMNYYVFLSGKRDFFTYLRFAVPYQFGGAGTAT
jgi:hypothetical protein